MNIMTIDGQNAVITYDPEIDMFRGEFLGLSGGADFYARDIESLRAEGRLSLKVYMDMCKEKGRDPFRHFSGKFNARIDPALHARAVEIAAAEGMSLNQFIERAIEHEVRA
jgi:predicted HicB family RNase H-like nuclease